MKPHKHAKLIKAWADGAQIQYYSTSTMQWRDCVGNPCWIAEDEYRVKPEEIEQAKWYENIPPQGVFCWVSDSVIDSNVSSGIISRVYYKTENGFMAGLYTWKYAKPLTREEALNLVWQGEE